MSKHSTSFSLLILVLSLACSNELIEPIVGKDKEPMETTRSKATFRSYQTSSISAVYKGASDNNLYYSQIIPNNNNCTALQKQIKLFDGSTPQSSKSPTQVFFQNKLYIIYKAGSSNDVLYSYYDGVSWRGDIRISIGGKNISSSEAPTAVVFENKLYIIYKAGASTDVYYSYFDGVSWRGDKRISIGTNIISTNKSPTAVVFNNRLYIVYKAFSSNNVYYSSASLGSDGVSLVWSGDIKIITTNGTKIQTSQAPSVAVFNNRIYAVYKAGSSNDVYYSSASLGSDGLSLVWIGDTRISINGTNIQTSQAPSVTVFNNSLYVAYKGGSSEYIYYSSFDDQVWRGNGYIYGIWTNSFANIIPNPYELKPFVSNLLAISPNEKIVNFTSSEEYPGSSEGHVQGIQVTEDGFLVSSSSQNNGLIIPIKLIIPMQYHSVQTNNVVKIPTLNHAGGIQFQSGTLAVALSKINWQTGEKKVRFYTDNLSNMQDFAFSSNDCSAAGFVDINDTERLVLVVSGSSMEFMEYQVLNKVNNQWMPSLIGWKRFQCNCEIGEVQNINLFKEGDLYYLIGLRNTSPDSDPSNRDALDVYTFTMGSDKLNLNLLGSLYVVGGNMRNAGGVNVMSNGDIIISSLRDDIKKTGLNKIYIYTK